MNHVGSTVLFAQAVVRRARVEHHRAKGAGRVGDRKNLGRGKVDDEKAHTVGQHFFQGRDRIFAWRELGVDDREGLIEEAASRVVVVHRHARAGDEVVRGRDVEDRDRFARMGLVDDADFDRKGIRIGGLSQRREQSESRDEKSAKRRPTIAARGNVGRAV